MINKISYEISKYKENILERASNAYNDYLQFNSKLQNLVPNIDKLLEYVDADLIEVTNNNDSVALLDGYSNYGISTLMMEDDTPTIVPSVDTSEFIELNLYDYGDNINDRYKSNNEYPGFQWNGGAYMYKTTYNRHSVDYIDFGNSLINNFSYGTYSDNNKKSSNATNVVSLENSYVDSRFKESMYTIRNTVIKKCKEEKINSR